MVLTVACVPTGMKMGVSITPWGVCSRPRRAPVWAQTCSSSNSKGFDNLITPDIIGGQTRIQTLF